jgi:putative SOS response-associated peptidase YedK
MCSHFEALRQAERYLQSFAVQPPPQQSDLGMWPKSQGVFIRKPPETDPHDEAVPEREAINGRWGLVPGALKPASKDRQLKLSTFNARSESVAKSFTFGGAWRRGQHCIVPATAFYEPDWRSGKAVPTRFTRADGLPMGIAGLWDEWHDPATGPLLSFTMLTINADKHALLSNFHRPGHEKRMIVVLPESEYAAWLDAPASDSMDFMRAYAAEELLAAPALLKLKAASQDKLL